MRSLNEREEVSIPLAVAFSPIVFFRVEDFEVAVFGALVMALITIFYSKYFFSNYKSKSVVLLGSILTASYGLFSCQQGYCWDFQKFEDTILWSDSLYIIYVAVVLYIIRKNYSEFKNNSGE